MRQRQRGDMMPLPNARRAFGYHLRGADKQIGPVGRALPAIREIVLLFRPDSSLVKVDQGFHLGC